MDPGIFAVYIAVAPEKKDEATPPWVVTRRQFKQDYVGYLDSRRTHLFVFDVASKEMLVKGMVLSGMVAADDGRLLV